MKVNRNLLPFLILFLVVLGCGRSGPETYPVTGTVSYQGKPLPLGIVMFVPKQGPSSKPAAIDEQGHYRLDATAGEHRVAVVAMPPRTGGRPDPTIEGGYDYTGVPEAKSLIPKKYNHPGTSEIQVVVKAQAMNTIDIVLK